MTKVPDNIVGAGDIQDLAVAVEQLASEVQVLRQTLDELRDDVVWSVRNLLASQPHTILMSTPFDPHASEWCDRGDRQNRCYAEDLLEGEDERPNAADHHAAAETGKMPAATPIVASQAKSQSALFTPQKKLF